MRILTLATSFPRHADDVAGRFVADQVEALRSAGVAVHVVSPADFRHFGIAFGHGIVQNLRARPWLGVVVPAFLWEFARAARAAAHDVDLVHAHWIPSGLAALTTRRPYVLQLWGTDVELARRVPWLARPVVRRARVVLGASSFLAEAAVELGAREARVVPSAVEIPEHVDVPQEPPHVLFAGRLSPEKGILEFLEATQGLPRAIVGDGPLRDRVPEAVGFVPPSGLGRYYERAAVVCVPSRREGVGMTAREAMAWGRPVVATAVGGLRDVVRDRETGLVVPPHEVGRLRDAVELLLGDPELRLALGRRARDVAREELSRSAERDRLLDVYRRALAP